jgi:arginyl-tRNA synthetase
MEIEKIIKAIEKVTGTKNIDLEVPEREEFGEYSTNVALKLKAQNLKLKTTSQKLKFEEKDNFRQVAEAIVEQLKEDKELMRYIEKIEVAGSGFINFYLKNEVLLENLQEIIKKEEDYGKSDEGKNKVMVIDYSAPNIAKRFSIGHLRSTIIGQALYNLYSALGYETIGDNHLGDWGTQFGTLLYQIDSKKLDPDMLTIEELEELYVEFHIKAEEDPSFKEGARTWFKKLEDSDEKARSVWKILIAKSLEEFERIYRLLDVKIDHSYGESFYQDIMLTVIEDAKDKGIAKVSQGALVINVPDVEDPLLLVKSDGGTTYATRDLATLKFRKEHWDPDLVIYEVGVEQTLHFQQVFAAAKMLGYVEEKTQLVHTKHGWYLGEDGKKFSTRKGKTVKLEDILEEAIERAKKLSNGDEELARKVGVGAIKYFDLSHNIQSDIVFSWEKMFVMEGNSGPYLQYTFARTQSVLAKALNSKSEILNKSQNQNPNDQKDKYLENLLIENYLKIGNLKLEINEEEKSILRSLSQYPGVISMSAKMYSPNLLCNYLYDLAQKFNLFYSKHRIIENVNSGQWPVDSGTKRSPKPDNRQPNTETRQPTTGNFRLALTAATGQVLKNGLNLLGINTPERM